jgi:hypothetical protein
MGEREILISKSKNRKVKLVLYDSTLLKIREEVGSQMNEIYLRDEEEQVIHNKKSKKFL